MFGGSPELLLTNLVESRGADAAELARLRAVLERHATAPTDVPADAPAADAARDARHPDAEDRP